MMPRIPTNKLKLLHTLTKLTLSVFSPSQASQKSTSVLFCSLQAIWEGQARLQPVNYISYDVILWTPTAPMRPHPKTSNQNTYAGSDEKLQQQLTLHKHELLS